MLRSWILTSLISVSASTATPVFAQTTPAASPAAPAGAVAVAATAPAKTRIPPKPDRMICEDEDSIGTRLGGHRVCKTASAWAQERGEARSQIERSQTNRGVGGPNG